jgi:hypothetical protein
MTNPTFNDVEISIAFEVAIVGYARVSTDGQTVASQKGGRSREDLSRDGKRCLAPPTVKATLREWVQS